MKYIKPPDFKSVQEFEAHFKKIEQDITELLTDCSASTANELNEKLSQAVSAAVSYLSKLNRDFTDNELPKAFQEGKERIHDVPKVTAKEAAAILERQGFKYSKNSFSRDTYVELQSATKNAGNGLKMRVNSIIKDLHKTGQDSVYNVQQAILKDLEQNGIFTITYANGAKQSLHSYAAMAARSARIESVNIGEIGCALQSGTDFVKMTEMPQCCKLCGAYQGKVYSISGKDKRFPALFKTVLKNGYALPHPNCRHEFIPWHEEIEDPADVEKAIKDSRIQYDAKGNLVDVRSQSDIKGYAQWQAGNRQLNREYLEYERMKAYYAEQGKEPPYKTLGSFRRARRSDTLSPAFKAWKHRNRDIKQYENWKNTIGEKNMPKTLDEFQHIKYNKDTRAQFAQLQRERNTINSINRKKWTDLFKARARDAYYNFRKYGIELSDHGVARFLQRGYIEQEIVDIHNRPFNYVQQEDGKKIKYYNQIAVVYNPDGLEIVSILGKNKARGDWNEVKDKNSI